MANIRFHITRKAGAGLGFFAESLAESAGGHVDSTVPGYDGANDLAIVSCPSDNVGYLRDLLGQDKDVLVVREHAD